MPSRFGSATQRRLDVTLRRHEVEKRAAREARRRAGIPEPTKPYRPHRPYKKSGRDHRTFYALKVETGFVLALLLLTGLVRSPMYGGGDIVEVVLAQQELIVMEEILQTRQDQPPPPPPRPPVPVEVPDDVILDDDVLNLDATLDLDDMIAELPPPPPEEEEAEEEEPEIFVVVEQPPVMIGGLASLMKQMKYPEMARQAEVEGRVTVEFVVDEQGNVTEPVVLRGIGAGCDQEALRVIQLMKFEPGRQRGRPVKVRMATGVNFRLAGG